jgi:hypothetical protein
LYVSLSANASSQLSVDGGAPCTKCELRVGDVVHGYTVAGGNGPAASPLPKIYVVSVAELPVSANTAVAPGQPVGTVTLPANLGQLDILLDTTGAAPSVTLRSEPGAVLTIAAQISAGAPSSGTIQLSGGPIQATFSFSASAMQINGTSSQTIAYLDGTAAISNVAIALTANSAILAADASYTNSALGTLTLKGAQLAVSGGSLSIDTTNATWQPDPSKQLKLGSLHFGFASVSFTAAPVTVTFHGPTLTSNCGTAALPDLSFRNGAAINPANGTANVPITPSAPIQLPVGNSLCLSISSLTFAGTMPGAGAGGSFTASLTGSLNWNGPSSSSLKFANLGVGATTTGITISSPSTITYDGPLAFGAVNFKAVQGTINRDGSVSLTALLLQGNANRTISLGPASYSKGVFSFSLTADKNAAISLFNWGTLTNVAGTVSIGASQLKIALFSANLTITLLGKQQTSGQPVAINLDVDQADGSSLPAVAGEWNGSRWVSDPSKAKITLAGSQTTVRLGDFRLALQQYDGGGALKPAFSSCADSDASYDGTSGKIVLCGQISLNPDAAIGGVLSKFCVDVAAAFEPDAAFDFETLTEPPASPATIPPSLQCADGFTFAATKGNLFQAHFQDFSISQVPVQEATAQKPAGTYLEADLLVQPLAGVPGVSGELFSSALFDFSYTPMGVALNGTVSSLRAFSIPNVANYQITSLAITATYRTECSKLNFQGCCIVTPAKDACTDVALVAGDSSAQFPGALGVTVYGKGGGLEYHQGKWSPKLPGVKIPQTLISFAYQLISSGLAYTAIKHVSK